MAISALGSFMAGNAAAATGKAQQQAADYSALVLGQQAGQVMATASAGVQNQDIQTQYALSHAKAQAAAGGGSATSAGAVSIFGQIAARGEYNALSTLYTGQEKAAGMTDQAALDVYQGNQEAKAGQEKQEASYIGGIGSAMSSFGGIAARYGWGGEPTGGGNPSYGAGGTGLAPSSITSN
jgi:hypothetical protein